MHRPADRGADAIAVPAPPTRLHTLPNGLTVILRVDRSAPVLSAQAWCAAGSIHEDAWLGAGLSHILEHMLFKGTSKRGAGDIATAVQEVGGYMNAYTSFDRTVYWIDCPKAGATTAVEVLCDVVTDATIPADEFEKEQDVIRREFAMGFDDPDRMASQLMFATCFQLLPYGHPVMGYLDVFDQLTRDDVLDYYRTHYVPNNLFFTIVGDIDEDALLAQISERFEKIPRRPLRPVFIPSEPEQLGRREIHQTFATPLSKLNLAWRIPDLTHPDMPALDVLATILGAGRSARLHRAIRDRAQLAHHISAYSYTPTHGGLFIISADTEPGQRDAAQQAILDTLSELVRDGVTEDELGKARKMTLSSHLAELTTMRGQASELGSNWHVTRNLDFSANYLRMLQRVDREAVRTAAARHLVDDGLSIVSLNPPVEAPAVATDSKTAEASEIEEVVLPGGLTVLLRSDPRLPLVSIQTTMRGGLLAESDATSGLCTLYASVLPKGTPSRSADEIADALEFNGGSIGTMSGNNSFGASVHCLAPDFSLGTEILADVLLHPSFPEDHVVREREIQLAQLREEDDHLMSVASRHLREKLFGDHPFARNRLGSTESVEKLDRARLAQFHEQFVTAGNTVLAVFGDIDRDRTLAEIETAFAALPSGERPFESVTDPQPLGDSITLEETRDKQQAVLLIGYQSADLRHEDRAALDLIDEACSDMASRLFMRIREELGLAYYVGTSQILGLSPGGFLFYAGTDPGQIDLCQQEIVRQIADIAAEGLDDHELRRAKGTLLGKQQISWQKNSSFAQATSLDELYGLGHNHWREANARTEAITRKEVAAVAERYFHGRPSVTVRVLPAPGK